MNCFAGMEEQGHHLSYLILWLQPLLGLSYGRIELPRSCITAPGLLFQKVPRIWGFETWNLEKCWSTDTSAFLIYFLDPFQEGFNIRARIILAEDGTLDAAIEVAASRVCAPQLCLRPVHVPLVLASYTGVSSNNFMAFWLTTHATATRRGALNSLSSKDMFLLKE